MTGFVILLVYIGFFVGAMFVVNLFNKNRAKNDFTSLKTVTFGDESAIRPNRAASIISIAVIFIIWGAFTNSKILPFHVPGPFVGETEFIYTAQNAAGETDDAQVFITVYEMGDRQKAGKVDGGDGFAKNDSYAMQAWRSELMKVARNDEGGSEADYRIIAVNGQPIAPKESLEVANGKVTMTPKGTLNFIPEKGLQMQPIWLPAPDAVVMRFVEIVTEGYKNNPLWVHIGDSLYRVIAGFILGSLLGIPLGYAMGLSSWFRGWFDPIVEFMRPVPPLALIPLVIIWFGIWEEGKIFLLFLAALWIMAIAARAGVSGVAIAKIHAAYSLGASKSQIMRHVIVPNSLPEIFTGARVAMGVCWGTVVASELVAAQTGIGMMIIDASKFQQTDTVILGIIIIGIIGFAIDVFIRILEKRLVPWKGRV